MGSIIIVLRLCRLWQYRVRVYLIGAVIVVHGMHRVERRRRVRISFELVGVHTYVVTWRGIVYFIIFELPG